MQLKDFFRLNNVRSLQIFQLLRFGSLLAVSIFFAWLIPKPLVGFYEKLLLIGSSSTFFWVSGIINPFIPFYYSQKKDKQERLVSNIFLLLSAFSVIVTILLFIFIKFNESWQQELFYYFLLYNLFNAPVFLTEYILLIQNKYKSIFWYGFIVSLLFISCLVVPLYWDKSLLTSIKILTIFTFCRYLFLLAYLHFNFAWLPDKKLVIQFLKNISPYVVSLIIGGSSIYIDSFVINHFFSDADFAVFRYGARELPFVLLLANAFSNVKSGELAKAVKENKLDEALYSLKIGSEKLMHWLFPATIVLLLISKPLYKLAYTDAFLPSAVIFNIYLLLIISRLAFPQTILLSLHKNRLLLKTSAAEWLVNLVMNIGLIFVVGMQGVAYATVIAFFFEKLLLDYYCKKNGIKLSSYFPVKTWLFYTLITIAVFVLSLYI